MSKKKIKNPELEKGHNKIRPQHDVSTLCSSNTTHPAFCFRYIQSNYCIKQHDVKIQAACAKRLQHLGKLTWAEIRKAPRHGAGHEIIEQDSINERLPPNTPGDRNFLVFRLGYKGKRSVMIGYRKGKVFYIVWIDPDGQVYNHG